MRQSASTTVVSNSVALTDSVLMADAVARRDIHISAKRSQRQHNRRASCEFTVLALNSVYDSSNSIGYSFVNITLCCNHRLSRYLGVC
jgi:hypothetical protein